MAVSETAIERKLTHDFGNAVESPKMLQKCSTVAENWRAIGGEKSASCGAGETLTLSDDGPMWRWTTGRGVDCRLHRRQISHWPHFDAFNRRPNDSPSPFGAN